MFVIYTCLLFFFIFFLFCFYFYFFCFIVFFVFFFFFFFQAEDGIRDKLVTGVQTCALPILRSTRPRSSHARASSWRRARLAVTPPDAVTQQTFSRPAARSVFATSTSTKIGRASCRERV